MPKGEGKIKSESESESESKSKSKNHPFGDLELPGSDSIESLRIPL